MAGLLIRLLRRAPIAWQRKLRHMAQAAEYYTHLLVIVDEDMLPLIENCATPDYVAFDARLAKMRARWGEYDTALEQLAIARRFSAFKRGIVDTTSQI